MWFCVPVVGDIEFEKGITILGDIVTLSIVQMGTGFALIPVLGAVEKTKCNAKGQYTLRAFTGLCQVLFDHTLKQTGSFYAAVSVAPASNMAVINSSTASAAF
jgi:hypothetical protein